MRFRLLINRGLLPVKFQCVRFMQSVKIPVIFWWSIGSVNIRANRRKSVSSDSVLIEWMRNSAVLRRPPTEQNRIFLTFLHQCRRKVSLKILYLSFCKFFFFSQSWNLFDYCLKNMSIWTFIYSCQLKYYG